MKIARPRAAAGRRAAINLTGADIAGALRAGVRHVVAGRDELNLINVYPVADGDTGTNLAHTLLAVDERLAEYAPPGAGDVLAAAADAAVDGARGNSGAIFAEFLQGVADVVSGREVLHGADLAAAIGAGERYARGALDEPQEGTILTVMSAVAKALHALPRSARLNPKRLLKDIVETARAATAATRGRLPATARANVVDAGAKGFALFVEGFAAELAGAEPAPGNDVQVARATVMTELEITATPGAAGGIEFRFCTECLVTGDSVDRRRLRDDLAPLGNSLVVAGSREKVRVHIHVAEPARVFELAARHGLVSGQKADDMQRQSGARDAAEGTVVVTDSAADLPAEMLDELGIHVVPLRIHFADRTYLDKVGLTPTEFLRLLAGVDSHPQTSQPAPGDFRRVYDYLASHYPHVLAITVSGRFSGTLQAARAAARKVQAGERITIIDSRNASLGQGLIARFAAERARAGVPHDVLEQEVLGAIGRTRSFGYIPDLRHAVRGGRLPRGIAWVAGVLRRTPLLEMSAGRLALRGLLRPGGDPVRPFAERVAARLSPGKTYRLGVAHAGEPGQAQALLGELLARIGQVEDSFVTELGPAVSVHGGPGTLIVSVQDTGRRN